MTIFDGIAFAAEKEKKLAQQVAELQGRGVDLKIASILFVEDSGSQFYTGMKTEVGKRVGIEYDPHSFSIAQDIETVFAKIETLNADPSVTGIIIQKPTRRIWQEFSAEQATGAFNHWWTSLTEKLDPSKDVDGLHPTTLEAITNNAWREEKRVLPATCQAVLDIVRFGQPDSIIKPTDKIVIIGISDLLGRPLFNIVRHSGFAAELLGRAGLEQRMTSGTQLRDADVVISATGVEKLISGEMLKNGVKIIDVGEPKPDVDVESVREKATFISPVPGGVGPVTVVCLLENCVKLHQFAQS